jgi:hypothetical protein
MTYVNDAQSYAVAVQRRARQIDLLNTERARAERALTNDSIGESGTPRPASMTAEIQKVIDELDAKAARLTALRGDELVAEFALD